MSMLYDTIKVIDDDYLIGLSNKGTVKRAYKDLEGMDVEPMMSEDKISFDFEGLKCELVMPLSDSSCSCPQIGICRHIVTLVLAAKKKLETGMADAETGDGKDEAVFCRESEGGTSSGESHGSGFSSDEEPDVSGSTGLNGNVGSDGNISPNNSTGSNINAGSNVSAGGISVSRITPGSASDGRNSGPDKVFGEDYDSAGVSGEATAGSSLSEKKPLDLGSLAMKEILEFPSAEILKKLTARMLYSSLERMQSRALPQITKGQIITVKDETDETVVKFIHPLSASGCSCHKQGMCSHKLKAMLFVKFSEGAFQLSELEEFLNGEGEKTVDKEQTERTEGEIKELLSELFATGLARLSPAMKDRFFTLALAGHNAGMANEENYLRELGNLVEKYQSKNALVSNEQLMEKAVKVYLSKDMAGEFRSEYAPVRNLHLVGLGCRSFHTATGYAGESVYFIEKNTGEYYSYTNARADFYDGKTRGGSSASPAPWNLGIPFGALAASSLVMYYGKSNPVHRLSSSSETRAEICGSLKNEAAALEKYIYDDFSEIWRDYFQDSEDEKTSDSPKTGYENEKNSQAIPARGKLTDLNSEAEEYQKLIMIKPYELSALAFDKTNQRLGGFLIDRKGRKIELSLQYKKEEAGAIRSLEKMAERLERKGLRPPVFLGLIYISDEKLCFYPIESVEEIGGRDDSEENREDESTGRNGLDHKASHMPCPESMEPDNERSKDAEPGNEHGTDAESVKETGKDAEPENEGSEASVLQTHPSSPGMSEIKQTLMCLKECRSLFSDLFTNGLAMIPGFLSERLSEAKTAAGKHGLIRLSEMIGKFAELMEQSRHGMVEGPEERKQKLGLFCRIAEYLRIGSVLSGRELAGARLKAVEDDF